MISATSCVQPTYEGLKLHQAEPVILQFPGFQPTYEGLKLPNISSSTNFTNSFPAYLRGIETSRQQCFIFSGKCFQPTYEGLKQVPAR
ncbi:MAG: hypothetical protein PWP58_548 [Bacillota bacterium]|nr:hypothetical protein [Bacillota bacterium]